MSEEKKEEMSISNSKPKEDQSHLHQKALTGKKKISKTIIIINVAALIIIASTIIYFLIIKKNNVRDSRGQAGRDFNIEDICKNYQDKGQDSGVNNFDPSKSDNRQRPEGVPDNSNFNSEEFSQSMEERQNLISDICADGSVSDEEKQQFEDMSQNMPSFGGGQGRQSQN